MITTMNTLSAEIDVYDRDISKLRENIARVEDDSENDETDNVVGKSQAQACVVSFSTIEIQEYPIITGDHPAVSKGVPVTIAWNPLETHKLTVDDYEAHKPTPRSKIELKMPSSHRTAVLRGLGFSRDEILKGTKAANLVRQRRRRTQETLQLAKVQEAFETLSHALRDAVMSNRDKQQRLLLERYSTTILPTKTDALDTVTVESCDSLEQS